MSYEVTATRKRPRDFESLAGQEFIVTTLKNSIKTGRIAHAYLFSGPRGVGKTSSARIIARALNCETGPTATPCGTCSHCKEIQTGNSMDVIEIDGASNTSVNDIREIKDEVLFAPNSCRYKIYIIDEVHMLSNSAFNALLKTIEEPPPYIIFIFATTETDKVPATIRSRCQQFNFRLIPSETIKELLIKICEESNIQAESDALFWIAKESTGSLRDAYTLFDQVLAFSDNKITLDKIKKELGLVGLDQINQLAGHFASGNRKAALLELNTILTQGVSAEQFIIDLTEYFRSLLFIKSGVTRESLLGYKQERFNSTVIHSYSLTQFETAISYLLNLYREIRFSLNQRFELELLVSKLCGLKEYFTQKELLILIKQLKAELTGENDSASLNSTSLNGNTSNQTQNKAQSTPTNSNEIFSPAPSFELNASPKNQTGEKKKDLVAAFNQSLSPDSTQQPIQSQMIKANNNGQDLSNDWNQLLEAINCHQQPAICSALSQAVDQQFEKNKVTIFFNSNFHADIVKENIKILEEAGKKAFNRVMVFHTSIRSTSQNQNNEKKQDPNVEMVVNIFRGQVVKKQEN